MRLLQTQPLPDRCNVSLLSVAKDRNRRTSTEDPLREIIEVASPRFPVVAVIINIPQMGHFVRLEVAMDALGEIDEAVFAAAGYIEQLKFCARGSWVDQELGRRFRVGRR
jgi:hypothetical protein